MYFSINEVIFICDLFSAKDNEFAPYKKMEEEMKKGKHLITIVLTVAMILTMMPSMVFADTEADDESQLALYTKTNLGISWTDPAMQDRFTVDDPLIDSNEAINHASHIQMGGYGTSSAQFPIFVGYKDSKTNTIKYVDTIKWESENSDYVTTEIMELNHSKTGMIGAKATIGLKAIGQITKITATTADGQEVTGAIKIMPKVNGRGISDYQTLDGKSLGNTLVAGKKYKVLFEYAYPVAIQKDDNLQDNLQHLQAYMRKNFKVTSSDPEVWTPPEDLEMTFSDNGKNYYCEVYFTPQKEATDWTLLYGIDDFMSQRASRAFEVVQGDLSLFKYMLFPDETVEVSVTSKTAIGPFKWKSSNGKVATVEGHESSNDNKTARITGVYTGDTTITAIGANGFEATCEIKVRAAGIYVNGEYIDPNRKDPFVWDVNELGTEITMGNYAKEVWRQNILYSTNSSAVRAKNIDEYEEKIIALKNTADGEVATIHLSGAGNMKAFGSVSFIIKGCEETAYLASDNAPLTDNQEANGSGMGVRLTGDNAELVTTQTSNQAYNENFIGTPISTNGTEFSFQTSLKQSHGGNKIDVDKYPAEFLKHLSICEATETKIRNDFTIGDIVASYNNGFTLTKSNGDNTSDPATVDMTIKVDKNVLKENTKYAIVLSDDVEPYNNAGHKRGKGTIWKFTTKPLSEESYTVTSTANTGGTITASSKFSHGTNAVYKYAPTDGYKVSALYVDGKEVTSSGNGGTYVFENIDDNHSISVVFEAEVKEAQTFSVDATCNSGGTITPSSKYKEGEDVTYTYTPDANHQVKALYVDSNQVYSTTKGGVYIFKGINSDHKIEAVFEVLPTDTGNNGNDNENSNGNGTEQPQSYTVKSSAGAGGTITPSRSYNAGSDVAYKYTPYKGYKVKALYVDGNQVYATATGGTYMFKEINKNHSIHATFVESSSVLGEKAVPKKAAPKKIKTKALKKKVKLTWMKSSNVSKYQVAYKQKGKKAWKYKTVSAKKKTVAIKKLKSNKKYQFKIRSYKAVKGKKIYSKWSKVTIVKVK